MIKKQFFDPSKIGATSPSVSANLKVAEVLDTICIYDNPSTGSREYWQNKKLINSVCEDDISNKNEVKSDSRIRKLLINGGDFIPKKLKGDIFALPALLAKTV
tara:strand:- start:7001 stop:7309 length:309 start_codon:yes stop_codon:yes gene_type:complete